jgi:MFS family permease
VSAYPVGVMSDRMERVTVLILGLFLLLLADGVLASGSGIGGLTASILLWGLHMGFTHKALAALIADTAPPELRGTAFGMLNLVSGLAQLCASVVAGALWDALGPQSTFLAGAAFVILTLAGLLPVCRRLRGSSTTVRA